MTHITSEKTFPVGGNSRRVKHNQLQEFFYGFIWHEVIRSLNIQLYSFFKLDDKWRLSGQFHVPAAITPRKRTPIPIAGQVGLNSRRTKRRTVKSLAPYGIRNPHPPRSLITIPIALSRLPGLPDDSLTNPYPIHKHVSKSAYLYNWIIVLNLLDPELFF